MIEIKDLSIAYGEKVVVKDLSLTLESSKITAIVGESGTGKSSLATALMGLNKGIISGNIYFNGQDILALRGKVGRQYRGIKAAMVHQQVECSLNPMLTILKQVMAPMIDHGYLNKKEAEIRAKSLLKEVFIEEKYFNKYPSCLSGGQLQRALIAIAMANDPQVLILDEVSSALDSVSKQKIMAYIRRIAKNRTVLLISHDFNVVEQIADQTMILYGGHLLEYGVTDYVLNKPLHPYTRGLIRSYPKMATTKDLQGIKGQMTWHQQGCPFYNRCTQRLEKCAFYSADLKTRENRLIRCHRMGIVNVLKIQDLTKSYGHERVLQGINFEVPEGENLALVGESGSGKSTLANCIMGLVSYEGGQLFYEEEIIDNNKRSKVFFKNVQMIFQDPKTSMNMALNVLDILTEPLSVQGIGTKKSRKERALYYLKEVQLSLEEADLYNSPSQMSGGELQRLAIARALMMEPKLLIADEPTSALDVSVQSKIMKCLMTLQEKHGLSMVFITHDIALARKVSDKMIVLKKGRIIECGETSKVLEKPTHPYTRSLIQATSNKR